MPQIHISIRAQRDLKRLREFLRPKSQVAAERAAGAIIKSIRILSKHPRIGRPVPYMTDGNYELLIPYGNTGYVARYRFKAGVVTILWVKHQKEASP